MQPNRRYGRSVNSFFYTTPLGIVTSAFHVGFSAATHLKLITKHGPSSGYMYVYTKINCYVFVVYMPAVCWRARLPVTVCPMGGVLFPDLLKSFLQPEETIFITCFMHGGGILLYSMCIRHLFRLH